MPATLLVNVNMTLKNAYITDNIAKRQFLAEIFSVQDCCFVICEVSLNA